MKAAAIAGLFLLAAMVPARADTLKLATWTLDWLTTRPAGDPALPSDVVPRTPQDFETLQGYATHLGADVVAVQGVDGPAAAGLVFPGYDVALADDPVILRSGFVLRHGLRWTRNPDLLAIGGADPAPHHRSSGADVTLALPGGSLRLLSVHLKSGCRYGDLRPTPACAELRRQFAAVAGWIGARQADGVAFAVLGDLNRELPADDPLLAALGPVRSATAGYADPCWDGGRFVDHILLGGAARDWLQPGSLKVLRYAESDPAARRHLSGHCPVSVRLELPPGP